MSTFSNTNGPVGDTSSQGFVNQNIFNRLQAMEDASGKRDGDISQLIKVLHSVKDRVDILDEYQFPEPLEVDKLIARVVNTETFTRNLNFIRKVTLGRDGLIPLAILGDAEINSFHPEVPVSGTLYTDRDVEGNPVPPTPVILEGTPVHLEGVVQGTDVASHVVQTVPGVLNLFIFGLESNEVLSANITFTPRSSVVTFDSRNTDIFTAIETHIFNDQAYLAIRGGVRPSGELQILGFWDNCQPLPEGVPGLGAGTLTSYATLSNGKGFVASDFAVNAMHFDKLSFGEATGDNLDVITAHVNTLIADNLTIDKTTYLPRRFSVAPGEWYRLDFHNISAQDTMGMFFIMGYTADQWDAEADAPLSGQAPSSGMLLQKESGEYSWLTGQPPFDRYSITALGLEVGIPETSDTAHLEIMIFGNAEVTLMHIHLPTGIPVYVSRGFRAGQTYVEDLTVDGDAVISGNVTIAGDTTIEGNIMANNVDLESAHITGLDATTIRVDELIVDTSATDTGFTHKGLIKNHQIAHEDSEVIQVAEKVTFTPGWNTVVNPALISGTIVLEGVATIVKDAGWGVIPAMNSGTPVKSHWAYHQGMLYYRNDGAEAVEVVVNTGNVSANAGFITVIPTPILAWQYEFDAPYSVSEAPHQFKDVTINGRLDGAGIGAAASVDLLNTDDQVTFAYTASNSGLDVAARDGTVMSQITINGKPLVQGAIALGGTGDSVTFNYTTADERVDITSVDGTPLSNISLSGEPLGANLKLSNTEDVLKAEYIEDTKALNITTRDSSVELNVLNLDGKGIKSTDVVLMGTDGDALQFTRTPAGALDIAAVDGAELGAITLDGKPLQSSALATESIDGYTDTTADIRRDIDTLEDVLNVKNDSAAMGRLSVNGQFVDFAPDQLTLTSVGENDAVTQVLQNGPYHFARGAVIECYDHVYVFDTLEPKGLIFTQGSVAAKEVTDMGVVAWNGLINWQHIMDMEDRDVGYIINSYSHTDNDRVDEDDNTYLFVPNPALTTCHDQYNTMTLPVGDVRMEQAIWCHMITDVTNNGSYHNGFYDASKAVNHTYIWLNKLTDPAVPTNMWYTLNAWCLESGFLNRHNTDREADGDSLLTDGTHGSRMLTSVEDTGLNMFCFEQWEAHPETPPTDFIDDAYNIGGKLQFRQGETGLYDSWYDQVPVPALPLTGNNYGLHGTTIIACGGALRQAYVVWPDGWIESFAPTGRITSDGTKVGPTAATNWATGVLPFILPIKYGPLAGRRVLVLQENSTTAPTCATLILPHADPETDMAFPHVQTIGGSTNRLWQLGLPASVLPKMGLRWVRYEERWVMVCGSNDPDAVTHVEVCALNDRYLLEPPVGLPPVDNPPGAINNPAPSFRANSWTTAMPLVDIDPESTVGISLRLLETRHFNRHKVSNGAIIIGEVDAIGNAQLFISDVATFDKYDAYVIPECLKGTTATLLTPSALSRMTPVTARNSQGSVGTDDTYGEVVWQGPYITAASTLSAFYGWYYFDGTTWNYMQSMIPSSDELMWFTPRRVPGTSDKWWSMTSGAVFTTDGTGYVYQLTGLDALPALAELVFLDVPEFKSDPNVGMTYVFTHAPVFSTAVEGALCLQIKFDKPTGEIIDVNDLTGGLPNGTHPTCIMPTPIPVSDTDLTGPDICLFYAALNKGYVMTLGVGTPSVRVFSLSNTLPVSAYADIRAMGEQGWGSKVLLPIGTGDGAVTTLTWSTADKMPVATYFRCNMAAPLTRLGQVYYNYDAADGSRHFIVGPIIGQVAAYDSTTSIEAANAVISIRRAIGFNEATASHDTHTEIRNVGRTVAETAAPTAAPSPYSKATAAVTAWGPQFRLQSAGQSLMMGTMTKHEILGGIPGAAARYNTSVSSTVTAMPLTYSHLLPVLLPPTPATMKMTNTQDWCGYGFSENVSVADHLTKWPTMAASVGNYVMAHKVRTGQGTRTNVDFDVGNVSTLMGASGGEYPLLMVRRSMAMLCKLAHTTDATLRPSSMLLASTVFGVGDVILHQKHNPVLLTTNNQVTGTTPTTPDNIMVLSTTPATLWAPDVYTPTKQVNGGYFRLNRLIPTMRRTQVQIPELIPAAGSVRIWMTWGISGWASEIPELTADMGVGVVPIRSTKVGSTVKNFMLPGTPNQLLAYSNNGLQVIDLGTFGTPITLSASAGLVDVYGTNAHAVIDAADYSVEDVTGISPPIDGIIFIVAADATNAIQVTDDDMDMLYATGIARLMIVYRGHQYNQVHLNNVTFSGRSRFERMFARSAAIKDMDVINLTLDGTPIVDAVLAEMDKRGLL